jgi:hypothetical protein
MTHRYFIKSWKQLPTASPTYITDGVTDALRTSQSARMSDAWSVDTITDGFSDGLKSLAGFSNFFDVNIH